MYFENLKLTTIIILFSITGVGFAFSSTSVPIDSEDRTLPFSSNGVSVSSSTFTEILSKSTSTASPTTRTLPFSSNGVSVSSITSIRVVSTNPDPAITTVSGTDVEFTSQLPVVTSTNPDPAITTVSGTDVEFTSQLAVVTSSSASTTSTITGQSIQVYQIILDPATTSYSFDSADGFTELIITPEGIFLNIITIPSDVSNSTLNGGSNLVTEQDGSKTLSFANGFSIDATTTDVSVGVVFPDNLEINGPAEWDGVINLPTIKPTTLVDLGEGVEPTAVIEIGADDTPLSLNKPVQLTFDGQGDKQVFFTQGGVTAKITAICSGNTLADNIGLSEGGDCKITVASDLVVWTKHMTLASLGVPITNNPPDCSASLPSVDTIFPSNKKLVDVSITGVIDSDGDDISIMITGITQDETTNGLKGKDKSPDGFGVGTDTAQIRAQKDPKGNGRVYEISFDADDGNGGTCNDSVKVVVPKNKKTDPVDDGQNFDSTLP